MEIWAYQINTNRLDGVIGATDLAQVFKSYMEVNGKSQIPTGEVDGQLSKGIITANDLSGPINWKDSD